MMSLSGASFRFRALPSELQDKIWEFALGIDGPPIMQCVEVDFLNLSGAHTPTAYTPTARLGGSGTANASQYLAVRDVTQANKQARDAIERLQCLLRLETPSNIVELRVKGRDTPPEAEKVSIWLNTTRDVLCLQASSIVDRDLGNQAPEMTNLWFSRSGPYWFQHDFFQPLPFFGLDRFERVAIDWHCEVARRAIRHHCWTRACNMLQTAYMIQIYLNKGEEREYCSVCFIQRLNKGNSPTVEDADVLLTRMAFDLERGIEEEQELLGPDEQGTFVCKSCQAVTACGEGRVAHEMARRAPDWKPVCRDWHEPIIVSDMDTLFMGRLPSLKTFYIIDTKVKLRPGKTLTLPCEQFKGRSCKFVEVNTRDDAWDLNPEVWPSSHDENSPRPFHSFAFADELQKIAWDYACRQFTKARMDEQKANGEWNSDDDDSDDEFFDNVGNDDHVAPVLENGAGTAVENLRLNRRLPVQHYQLYVRAAYPTMGRNPSLLPSWPDSLLPVKVKVMARIDD
ncbi:hypothetical protein BR93DRAFT_423122 [Coniochaeta sp. PMI_546]|nr:hypothetical protein BR93DRAFT_423122 [Coniochaeta sp. PMI_546]